MGSRNAGNRSRRVQPRATRPGYSRPATSRTSRSTSSRSSARRPAYRRPRPTSLTGKQLEQYVYMVVAASFVIGVTAAIITGSGSIAFGSIILGLFFGFLIYTGMYN